MKLYWRYKKNGKWTWTALRVTDEFTKTLVSRLAAQDGMNLEEEA